MGWDQDGPRVNTRWKDNFLAELALTSDPELAAENTGAELRKIRLLLQKEPAFLAGWEAAKRIGYAFLEMELLRRLRSGDLEANDGSKYSISEAVRFLTAFQNSLADSVDQTGGVTSEDVRASIDRKVQEIRKRVARNKAAQSRDAE